MMCIQQSKKLLFEVYILQGEQNPLIKPAAFSSDVVKNKRNIIYTFPSLKVQLYGISVENCALYWRSMKSTGHIYVEEQKCVLKPD